MIDMQTNDLESEGLDIESIDLGTSNLESATGGIFSRKQVIVTFEDGTIESLYILTA